MITFEYILVIGAWQKLVEEYKITGLCLTFPQVIHPSKYQDKAGS